ncbi:glycoside hydrolase family 32 protein [Mesoplasma seiffertii]|uniref:glycoside hydrolase family 32 protein n=1 Tax=Mesoplasma seiffertii TaxID=28224 RepID=UPI000478DA5E|nr:glycoside hydrolase family 32 protein [Mesoplasma seiffertii]
MNDKYRLIDNQNLNEFARNHVSKEQDWYNNQYHLSAFSGLVNDPNGLVFYKGKYYIFMQNCPFSPEHKNKSWLLYTTVDFVNYIYEGITITPSFWGDSHGAFSGSAYVHNDELYFYYTGNIKIGTDGDRTSYTIKAKVDIENKRVDKKVLFETDKQVYTGHFRDPIVFEKNKQFYMLNGAQSLDLKGTINFATTPDLESDKWVSLKDDDFNIGTRLENYMLECPNYLSIQNRDVIFLSVEQKVSFAEGGHHVWYLTGNFDNQMNFKEVAPIRKLDQGLDYYAPQVFNNTGDRKITMAWLGNSQSEPKATFEHHWSNQLTVPRDVSLKNDHLYQKPVVELEKLRVKNITQQDKLNYENGLLEIDLLNEQSQSEFIIEFANEKNENIKIVYKDKKFGFDRSQCSYVEPISLPNLYSFEIEKITDLKILVDRSSMEIFVNEGQETMAVKFFVKEHKQIKTNLKITNAYQLQPHKIIYNNILFSNHHESGE